jgi:tetratricopeptide (TPR) repeat protein
MAKQRRVRPRPVKKKPSKSVSRSPVRRSQPRSKQAVAPPPDRAAGPAPPRAGYTEAVALYEQALQALQHRNYPQAAALLRSVLAGYPDEKELHERVRLYLNICERQAAPRESAPSNSEERVYAATLAVNAGNYSAALEHLRAVSVEEPENDHALYMLAVVHALRGEPDDAMPHLLRAIDLNAENRALARQDPDLENLRRQEAFRAAIEPASASRSDRRRPTRSRIPR